MVRGLESDLPDEIIVIQALFTSVDLSCPERRLRWLKPRLCFGRGLGYAESSAARSAHRLALFVLEFDSFAARAKDHSAGRSCLVLMKDFGVLRLVAVNLRSLCFEPLFNENCSAWRAERRK